MTEGQKVEVRFRGNLQPDEDIQLEQPFNSNMKCQINMYIAEVDKYAQKSFSSYRGFAQFYVEGGCSYVSMNPKTFHVYHAMVEFDKFFKLSHGLLNLSANDVHVLLLIPQSCCLNAIYDWESQKGSFKI